MSFSFTYRIFDDKKKPIIKQHFFRGLAGLFIKSPSGGTSFSGKDNA